MRQMIGTRLPLRRYRWLVAPAIAIFLGGGAAYAFVPPSSTTAVDACVNNSRGTVRILVEAGDACNEREMAISILGARAQAVDSAKLGGKDPSEFLGASETAKNSDRLGGLARERFLQSDTDFVARGTVIGAGMTGEAFATCPAGSVLLSGVFYASQPVEIYALGALSRTVYGGQFRNPHSYSAVGVQVVAYCAKAY